MEINYENRETQALLKFLLGFKIMLTNLIFIFKGRVLYLNMDSVDFYFGKRY